MNDEMNILREISSIAAAHGGNALSEMVGKTIELTLPTLETATPGQLSEKYVSSEIAMCVHSRVLSGARGTIILLFGEKAAYRLLDMCCQKTGGPQSGVFTEMGLSAIKEIGNVIIGAYAGALAVVLRTPIIPSIPTLINGPVKEILDSVVIPYGKEDYVLMIEAQFHASDEKVNGGLYLILTPDTIIKIQKACRETLDRLE